MADGLRYKPYGNAGPLPTDCCDFSVVDETTGIEICRCWDVETARHIAFRMNLDGQTLEDE